MPTPPDDSQGLLTVMIIVGSFALVVFSVVAATVYCIVRAIVDNIP